MFQLDLQSLDLDEEAYKKGWIHQEWFQAAQGLQVFNCLCDPKFREIYGNLTGRTGLKTYTAQYSDIDTALIRHKWKECLCLEEFMV